MNKHPVRLIFTSDLLTDFQELGQDVLKSTLLLGYTRFSSVTGLSSVGQMEVLLFHSNHVAWISALLVLYPVLFSPYDDQYFIAQISHVLKRSNNNT